MCKHDMKTHVRDFPRAANMGKWIGYLLVGLTLIAFLSSDYKEVHAQDKPKDSSNAAIIFSALRDGNRDIFVINADGTDERRLTSDLAEDRQPVWSPDRQHIVFSSNRVNPASESGVSEFGVWIMDANGENVRPVVADGTYTETPRWSPDGSQIVYVSDARGSLDLYVVGVDGTNPVRLTDDAGEETEPAWSPDGNTIAYSGFQDTSYSLFLYNIGSSRSDALYSDPNGDVKSPAWSSDGQEIAYTAVIYDAAGVYSQIGIYSLDTRQPIEITQINGQYAGSVSWSPDDNSVAYALYTPPSTRTLQTINIDGQGIRQLQTSAGSGEQPNWSSPQGARVLATEGITSGGQTVGEVRPQPTRNCPGVLPSRLVAGDTAWVTPGGTANRLRSGPGTNYDLMGRMQPGTVFEVISGPECNRYAWYEIEYQGGIYYTAEADGSTYWIGLYDETAQQQASSGSGIRSNAGSGRLLSGGRGLTNGAAQNNGNFQVEYYCNRQGYGISNDNSNWYCVSGGRRVQTLGQRDFDQICRETYNNSQAYAVRNGTSGTPAYNWRCYGP